MSAFNSIRFSSGRNGIQIYKMLINGKWVESSSKETFDVFNPADNSLIGTVQKATKKDAEKAVNSAFKAKKVIASMSAVERADILFKAGELVSKHRKEFVDIIVAEAGKPLKVAEGEVNATADRLRYAAEEAKAIHGMSMRGDNVRHGANKIGMLVRQPLGVVLAISPFNYPLFIAVAKIAPAIAGGNSVVSKPASDDPICLLMLAKVLQDAGLPPGVFNVVTGGGGDIGDFLAAHEKIDMISFTGCSSVGNNISKIAGMKKLHMELGGKAPAIVLEDADLGLAVKECAAGGLKYSGQRCDAVSRVLVVNSIADKFVRMMVKEVKNWKSGNTKSKDTQIGPLINQKAVDKVDELVYDAKMKGAKVLIGGKKMKGLYYAPTVLDNVTTGMKIAWEETFGPVVTIMRVRNYEEAMKIANESQYGLDACIFTENVDKAMDAGLRMEAGTVNINAAPAHGLANFPFGGDKNSGMGREGIGLSVEEMTKLHSIIFNPRKK